VIPQRNLSLLSNRLARAGGRRIPEAVLERDYCLAWFLIGLSGSSLREHLVFNGATALKRCYFGDYRFSEDLDFTLASEIPIESILAGLQDVYARCGALRAFPSATHERIARSIRTATRSTLPTKGRSPPPRRKRSRWTLR